MPEWPRGTYKLYIHHDIISYNIIQGINVCAANTPSECLETFDNFYTTCGFPNIEKGIIKRIRILPHYQSPSYSL